MKAEIHIPDKGFTHAGKFHSDDVFDNDTNYTDSQNAAQTEKSDADYGQNR